MCDAKCKYEQNLVRKTTPWTTLFCINTLVILLNQDHYHSQCTLPLRWSHLTTIKPAYLTNFSFCFHTTCCQFGALKGQSTIQQLLLFFSTTNIAKQAVVHCTFMDSWILLSYLKWWIVACSLWMANETFKRSQTWPVMH